MQFNLDPIAVAADQAGGKLATIPIKQTQLRPAAESQYFEQMVGGLGLQLNMMACLQWLRGEDSWRAHTQVAVSEFAKWLDFARTRCCNRLSITLLMAISSPKPMNAPGGRIASNIP